MGEGIASLLYHDVATAKKYYDVTRGVSAARRTRRILATKMEAVPQRREPPSEVHDRGGEEV